MDSDSSGSQPSLLSSTSSASPKRLDDDFILVQKDADITEMCQCIICFERYTNAIRAPITMPCGHTFCKTCISVLVTGKLLRCVLCQNVNIVGFGPLMKNVVLTEVLAKFGLLGDDENATIYTPPKSTKQIPEAILEGINVETMKEYTDFFLSLLNLFLRTRSRIRPPVVSYQHVVNKIMEVKSVLLHWLDNAVSILPNLTTATTAAVTAESLTTPNNPISPDEPSSSSHYDAAIRFTRVGSTNLYRPIGRHGPGIVRPLDDLLNRHAALANDPPIPRNNSIISQLFRPPHCVCPPTIRLQVLSPASTRMRCNCPLCSPDCLHHR